jgi:hypothetical protein
MAQNNALIMVFHRTVVAKLPLRTKNRTILQREVKKLWTKEICYSKLLAFNCLH